jgi:hypothetical protein
MSRTSISGDSEAGPIVATILVLCTGSAAFMTRWSYFSSSRESTRRE